MTAKLLGRIDWGVTRSEDSHRDYFIKWLVEAPSTGYGPQTISFTPGLAAIGAPWTYGTDNDAWAFCTPAWTIAPFNASQERSNLWTVTQPFTTRPMSRCQDQMIENPLLEPPRLAGSYVKYVRQGALDRHGNRPRSISGEPLQPSALERDDNRPVVRVEVTTLGHELDVVTSMIDTVNDANLWGLSPRKIKLSNLSWRRYLYGLCTYYFVRDMEFEINFKTFDKKVPDESRLALSWATLKLLQEHGLTPEDIDPVTVVGSPAWTATNPRWYGDPAQFRHNPRRYAPASDPQTKAELGYVRLDDWGRIWVEGDPRPPNVVDVEFYAESNFLLLGIPAAF
jgi:hypothetical protein